MEQQRINSKKSNKFNSEVFIDLKENYKINFTGYESCKNDAKILDIYINGESTTEINVGQKGTLLLILVHSMRNLVVKLAILALFFLNKVNSKLLILKNKVVRICLLVIS